MGEQKSYYDEEERRNPLIKIIAIILLVLLLLVAVFIIYNRNNSSLEKVLIKTTKKYYEDNGAALPAYESECETITLSYLIKENKITNAKKYDNCDADSTLVKVCKLPSGNYQYTPFISCNNNEDTVFDDFVVGDEKDLVVDKSDVRFKYIPRVYTSNEKVYYPGDKKNANEVKESYISAPKSEYSIRGEAVKGAAKWYKESTGTTYWNNGSYSSVAPSGYPSKGAEGTSVVKLSLTIPATAEYRTIEEVKLYRTRSVTTPTPYKWVCSDGSGNTGGTIVTDSPCTFRTDKFKTTQNIYYTCDKEVTSESNPVNQKSKCPTSDWAAWTTDKCSDSNTTECEATNGYKYTDKTWKWYVTGTYRSYYPSGSATAQGENTYYASSPASGYVKDSSTETTAYKYYKLVESKNNNGEGEWVKLTEDYVELDEMIKVFTDKKYEVSEIADIIKNKEISFVTQIEYANRK